MSSARKMGWALVAGGLGLAALVLAVAFGAASARASTKIAGAPAKIADPSAVDAIHFDHTIHVGKYGMQCLDCHVYATESTVAGLPPVAKCMGCHKFVDKEKPGVQALATLWREGKAPVWQRVYSVPDYVYFSHEVHLAAKVQCQSCHGDVGSMHTVRRVTSLSMGFCLRCHEARHAPVACIACHK